MKYSVKRKQPQRLDRFGWGDPHAADCFLQGTSSHPGARTKFNPNHAPAGTPEGGQFASASGSPVEKARDAAFKQVITKGKDGKEHMIGLDSRTGEKMFHADSDKTNRVSVPKSEIYELLRSENAIDIIHNHPAPVSLSPQDVSTLRNPGEHSITAVLDDGTYFTATRNGEGEEAIDRVRDLFSPKTSSAFSNLPEEFQQLFTEPPLVAKQWNAIGEVLKPMVDSGKISFDDADRVGAHALWKYVASTGAINYTAHLAGVTADVIAQHPDLANQITKTLSRVK